MSMPDPPNALVMTAAGINCDVELGRAFELAGAQPEFVHLNELIADPTIIDSFDLIGLPGGFSFGDAIAAGRVMAALMRQHLYAAIVRAIERRAPIFAPCNGFQIFCQMGLLPGIDSGITWPESPPKPTIALAQNERGRFVDDWTRVSFPESQCIWTAGLSATEETRLLPSAHGEGRFMANDPSIMKRLQSNGQIAVRYHAEDNFNGSTDEIAGICDTTGCVFGLMPHPERFVCWEQHPFWTRLDSSTTSQEPIGLQMFRNAVRFAEESIARNGAEPEVATV